MILFQKFSNFGKFNVTLRMKAPCTTYVGCARANMCVCVGGGGTCIFVFR